MTATMCPECGAECREDKTCWQQLGEILAWEHNDPELAREHFLTVASYNLQHTSQFTDEAIQGLRMLFIRHLDEGLPVSEIRKINTRAYEGDKKVLRPASEREPELRQWPTTIANVYMQGDPAGASARVRAWAQAIRDDLSGGAL